MINKNNQKLSKLGYGTSTFVAGKLNPQCNSEQGLAALNYAVENGINVIHSNHSLYTQWGVKEVLKKNPVQNTITHLIKLKIKEMDKLNQIDSEIMLNCESLGSSDIILQFEFSDKNLATKENIKRLDDFLTTTMSNRYRSLLYIENANVFELAMQYSNIQGWAAKFNVQERWLLPYLNKGLLDDKILITFSPFCGNKINANDSLQKLLKEIGYKNGTDDIYQYMLAFCLSFSEINTCVTSMGNIEHVKSDIMVANRCAQGYYDSINMEMFERIR